MGFSEQAGLSAFLLAHGPAFARIRALRPDIGVDLVPTLTFGAADFAETVLVPLNLIGDREGARLEDGQVRTPDAYKPAWKAFAEAGWLGMDLPERLGGQGLPLALQTAAELLFNRAAMAFSMLPGSTRAAVSVLDLHAHQRLREAWAPKLVSGQWSATICVSEADAGSDLGRIGTLAEKASDNRWLVTGRKSWISFGGHDLTERIGHMLLARTGTAQSGTRGLSLFLVPDRKDDGTRNGVVVERIEEKLGLHGAPTCVLRFDAAEAELVGVENRGLPQLFLMIERMRLLTGVEGAGIAHGALDIAFQYARERRQGGEPDRPALPIAAHADVQRQLGEMAGRVYTLHAFLLELAAIIDLSRLETDATVRAESAALAAFLLPLAKTFGGVVGFDTASRAMQILGGAGYTREWPIEHYLRDVRVTTILEGTSGMQALDLLQRRLWKEEAKGLHVLGRHIRAEIAQAFDPEDAETAAAILGEFEALATGLIAKKVLPRTAEYAADAFMEAAWAAVSAWMALRLIRFGSLPDAPGDLLVPAGQVRLAEAGIAMQTAKARAALGESLFSPFGEEA